MTTRTGDSAGPDSFGPRPVEFGATPVDPLPWHVDPREGVLMGDVLGVAPAVSRARWQQLSPVTAHGLARLRVEVFVVEAQRPYPELDERDLDPTTEHLWIPDGELPVACLRVVRDDDGVPLVDRACARADVRHLGLTSALLTDVVARHGAGPLRALAPPAAASFFLHHGFEVLTEPSAGPGGRRVRLGRRPEAPWR